MRKTIAILAFLCILAGAVSAASCSAGFEENVTMQIVDAKLRPLENASAQITYQVDKTTGQGYATTLPKTTGPDGMLNFIIRNREVLDSRVDCSYVITAFYDNKKVDTRVTVGSHPSIISITLPIYRLSIIAVDQKGNVLNGAVLTARNFTAATNNQGKATLNLGSGDADVVLKYGQGTVLRTIKMAGDLDYNYEVEVYDLNLYVVDDQNAPLQVTAAIGGKNYQTDANGFVSVKKLLTSRPHITTTFRGITRDLDANLALGEDYYMVYDIHAPKVKNLLAEYKNGGPVLRMSVDDEGLRASGLAPDGIRVKYTLEGRDYLAPVYTTPAKDEYEALFGAIDHNSVIEIFIEARDIEGNIRNVKGYFSVEFVNETVGGNQTGTGDNGGESSGFQLEAWHIVVIGIVLVALLLGLKFIRDKLNGT